MNVGLFVNAALLIIFLTSPGSNHAAFAWSTVRYQTTATELPQPHGTCPGIKDTSKPALVVSHVSNDGPTDWLDALKDKYHLCIYEVDAPDPDKRAELRVPANRGHEAMSYLTFLIDNYDHIPAAGAVFVHGSRWAWHNDNPIYDNAELLRRLDVPSALAPHGYHNMRCDWSAGTCNPSSPAQGGLEMQVNAKLTPWDARMVSDAAIPGALAAIFGGSGGGEEEEGKLKLGRADVLRSQCCAQFVVSRANILRHSREEYVALRQWLLDDGNAAWDDRVIGRIVSYVWHVLFIQSGDGSIDLAELNEKACPKAGECYCRLYGMCELKDCTDDGCPGQYEAPPGYKLPADWAETHSSKTGD